jgi:hypothetical protein
LSEAETEDRYDRTQRELHEPEKKVGFFTKVKQGLEERSNERKALKTEAKAVEKEEYRKGFLEGKAKSARAKGRKAGMSAFGGGLLGGLAGTARTVGKHVQVRDTGDLERSLGFGASSGFGSLSTPKVSELGFGGFGERAPRRRSAPKRKTRRKSAPRRDLYSEYGF